jgi:DNA polymerase III epsilon subunit family exonuclease
VGLGREFVVFDTETTGMPPAGRLVEIGALKVRGGHVVERFERLVFPECPIPPQVTAIHGIRDADVAAADDAGLVVKDFIAWAGSSLLVGHNVAFDAAIVAAECRRFGIPPPDNPTWCTLRAARSLLRRPSHSLEALVLDLGLPPASHHRALADAEHTLNLLWNMTESAGERLKLFGHGRVLSDHAPEPVTLPAAHEILREAHDTGEAVGLKYRLASGWLAQCQVTPRFFYRRSGQLWMEALCHEDCFFKSYRLDRVVAARLCHDAAPVELRRNFGAWRGF